MNVSAYELKTRCGEMIDRAAAGEEIVITKRGVVRAKLVPPDHFDAKQQAAVFDRMRAMREKMRKNGVLVSSDEIHAALQDGRR